MDHIFRILFEFSFPKKKECDFFKSNLESMFKRGRLENCAGFVEKFCPAEINGSIPHDQRYASGFKIGFCR